MSNNSNQRQASSIASSQQTTEDKSNHSVSENNTSSHYVKYHGYTPEEFAERGETTQFNGIQVIDESTSEESEEFGNFTELRESDWKVDWASAARLADGTILYEGRQ